MKRKCKNKIKIYHWGNAEYNYMKYIKKTYNLAGSSDLPGNIDSGRISSRYYRLLYNGKEKTF